MAVFAFEGGDCSGSIVARQTGSKVGRSLTEVPLGSGADEGAQGLLAECLRGSLSRDAPRQRKGAQVGSSETHEDQATRESHILPFGRLQAGLRAGVTH